MSLEAGFGRRPVGWCSRSSRREVGAELGCWGGLELQCPDFLLRTLALDLWPPEGHKGEGHCL